MKDRIKQLEEMLPRFTKVGSKINPLKIEALIWELRALKAESQLKERGKQLCPKCHGQGIVSKPPWVPAEVTEWSSSATSFTCDVCNGAKVI